MPRGFSGDPVTIWHSGNRGFRGMQLRERISFTDHVREWVAEEGRTIDGASIPRALWTAVGPPYVGRYRRPSIIHDIACADATSDGDRRSADKMFYRACRAEGLSRVESAILYCGVRFGAWMSGGHLVADEMQARLTEDDSDERQQRIFAEIAQRVVNDADRLAQYGEEREAEILEQAYDASQQRTLERLLASSPESLAASRGSFHQPDDPPSDPKTLHAPTLLKPGHPPLPLAGDLAFDGRLVDSPCGGEDRVPVENTGTFPNSAICYLILNGRFTSARGTGFFIAPDTIVTAGHCLYGRLGYIRSAQIIAGRNGEDWPFSSVIARTFKVPAEWSRGRRAEYDYGIIKLDDGALGERVGHFDIAVLTDEELRAAQLTTAGYPSDIEPSMRQHVNSGNCEFVEPQTIGYSLDTWRGASGSPVWTVRDGRPIAVGIHNYGHCPNWATRINPRVLADLRRWISS